MRNLAKKQQGMMLIESLVGLLIFVVGVLAMLALQARAIATQADAQYRIEAANYAQRILGEISVGVDRTSAANLAASLAAFAHQPGGALAGCAFAGGASGQAAVTAWANAITNGVGGVALPGSTAARQQIIVAPGAANLVTINICWQPPNSAVTSHYTLNANIN